MTAKASGAIMFMTNRGRALMVLQRHKDGKLILSCTGGQRKKMQEEEVKEDAWTLIKLIFTTIKYW
jgi:Lon protease-like protein